MRKIGLIMAAGLMALVGACNKAPKPPAEGKVGATVVEAGAVTPVPLPDSANFPVAAATINGWVASGDTAAIRGHAWSLWQGMSAPSGQILNGQNLPIWETWAGPNDVFPATQVALAANKGPPAAATLEARLAKHDRGTGTAIGAVVGAGAGSYAGCQMQKTRAANNAGGAYNSNGIQVSNAVEASPMTKIKGKYVARSTLNLRASASTRGERIGSVQAGETFQALGRTGDGKWILVGQDGVGVGYVSSAYVYRA